MYITFRTLSKKDEPSTLTILEIIDSKRSGYLKSKRPNFRISFGKQEFSEFKTLLKSARHHYYRRFLWIWDKLSWKRSFLVTYEVLGLFVNTLTAEYMYSRRNMQNFPQQLQTQLSQKQKAFSGLLIAFLKCISTLKHLEKKDGASSLTTP